MKKPNIEQLEVFDIALEELVKRQASRDWNKLHELILEFEERGGDFGEAQTYFENHLANHRYADWLEEHSCGADEVEEVMAEII